MYRFFYTLFLIVTLTSVATSGSYIILDSGSKSKMISQKAAYETFGKREKFDDLNVTVQQAGETYLLQVGPLRQDRRMALQYLKSKQRFPHALLIEREEQSHRPPAPPHQTSKRIIPAPPPYQELSKDKTDTTIWIALFGLAITGILYMFLSSEQIKRLKEEYQKIKEKHKKLEQKQHEVLSNMSENIHSLAKETIDRTSELAKRAKETPLYKDIEKVMYNESELLNITEDLIKFLRIKSKKIVIQHDHFNFNHVLNEVAGTLSQLEYPKGLELIFAIEKNVPKEIISDPSHLGSILTNILDYIMQHTQNKEIVMHTTMQTSVTGGEQLHFTFNSHFTVPDRETLFESYYDERTRRYIGLGLYVAHELASLMNGSLSIHENAEGYAYFKLILPIEEKSREKRKYNLPQKDMVGKRVLIVDASKASANATKTLFEYFKAKVTIASTQQFHKSLPNFSQYDIVVLNQTLFSEKVENILSQLKEKQDIKVISLENLFAPADDVPQSSVIDTTLMKPLTQEYLYDTLVSLYTKKPEKKRIPEVPKETPLPIRREPFEDIEGVTLESFSLFEGSTILIVEDNVINQKVVMSVLGQSKMHLIAVNNGQEAIDYLMQDPDEVDLVLMDISMPVMDGYTATQKIREDHRLDHIPIVALTALTSEHEIEKMFESGMNGFLSKPLHIEKLYHALEVFLLDKNKKHTKQNKPHKEKPIEDYEGLSIKKGLGQTSKNEIFYKEVLREFLSTYGESDLLFEKLVHEKRYEQIKIFCMDMKGLAGTIGAVEMYTILNEIHQYLIYKKPELIDGYVKRFRETFQTLKNSIERYLSA